MINYTNSRDEIIYRSKISLLTILYNYNCTSTSQYICFLRIWLEKIINIAFIF